MNPARWSEVEAVLDATLDSDPSRWPAIVEQRCAGDADLRREVEALLGRYDSALRFLDSPPAAAAAAMVAEAQAAARAEGKRIGPYRIVRQLGQGGTARVFLAERDDGQFSQRVALEDRVREIPGAVLPLPEGQRTREQLEQHDAELIHVRLRRGRFTPNLFGRGVFRRHPALRGEW